MKNNNYNELMLKKQNIYNTKQYNFLTTDKDGNIYATNHDQVYKSLAGKTNFIKMTGIPEEYIINLTTDKNGNIYATSIVGIFKCLAGEKNFIKMTGITDVLFFSIFR